MSRCRYLCERCGGTGVQEAGCWDGKAYSAPAGVCTSCDGEGLLGEIGVVLSCTCPVINGMKVSGSACPLHGLPTVTWEQLKQEGSGHDARH